ncbi:MAG TPA: hypothetical protein VM263_06500 [Acidimicrobiales bacterium]|nr:hypothetical protein [Acidimicrobiales bacterium]
MGARWRAVLAVVAVTGAGACGSDGGATAATDTSSTTAGAAISEGADGYQPVSDVGPHAAVGLDAKEIRALMEPATSGGTVDWAAVGRLFTEGKSSTKGDGSLRTLAGLAPTDPVTAVVTDAIAGTGASAGSTDAVRRQAVDKGITVLLERKVLGELAAAAGKVAKGEVAPASGAPHNVDEAWAFYTAEGNGPASTAVKRAGDFGLDGKVHEAVVAGLSTAQAAAVAGDSAALEAATAEVEAALDYVFYLATVKYLDTGGDPVKRAEGEAFYLGIRPEVAAASPAADQAITAAFASGDASAGRAALNGDAVLAALAVGADRRFDAVP